MSRQSAREEAFKTLFQINFHEHLTVEKKKNEFTNILVTGIVEKKELIDQKIVQSLDKWTLDRLPSVERTILRIATYEMLYLEDIPLAVSINEAVELCHKYGDDKSGKFVNGVLSKMINEEK